MSNYPQFCRPLPTVSLHSLSLRIFFLEDSVRFIIHGASSERIERWVLNSFGEVLEFVSKKLETPIESFTVDRTGDIMVSYEENFMILRNHELRVFHSIKSGKEIPSNAVIVPQANTSKLHLIACYESGMVMVGEHLIADLSIRRDGRYQLQELAQALSLLFISQHQYSN